MPIKCRLIDLSEKGYGEVKPGDMWYTPWLIEKDDGQPMRAFMTGEKSYLSPQYIARIYPKRAPLMVCLPGGDHWCIDSRATDGTGWEVSGKVPNLTARPSILAPNYHGWLTDGELSDDLEGRSYEHC